MVTAVGFLCDDQQFDRNSGAMRLGLELAKVWVIIEPLVASLDPQKFYDSFQKVWVWATAFSLQKSSWLSSPLAAYRTHLGTSWVDSLTSAYCARAS